MEYKVFPDIENVVQKRKIKALYNHVINRKSEGRLQQCQEYQNLVKLFWWGDLLYYSIVEESDNYYKVIHYFNIYDCKGINRVIIKRKFGAFASTKMDKTDYNKIEFIDKVIQHNVVTITDKEKTIMEYIHNLLQDKKYILETDILDTKIGKCSKALVKRTITNEDILLQYGIGRSRANKLVKQRLEIENLEGSPLIIYKN